MLTKPKAWLCRDREFETNYVIVFNDVQPVADVPAYEGAEFPPEMWMALSDLRLEPGGEPIAIELTVEKARE